MLSRAEELEQVYIEMPKVKDTSEKLTLVIRANPHSIQENENLVLRSIVPNYKTNHFASLQNKLIDLTNDIYAQVSDHICVVETWLNSNTEYSLNIPERYDYSLYNYDNWIFF